MSEAVKGFKWHLRIFLIVLNVFFVVFVLFLEVFAKERKFISFPFSHYLLIF